MTWYFWEETLDAEERTLLVVRSCLRFASRILLRAGNLFVQRAVRHVEPQGLSTFAIHHDTLGQKHTGKLYVVDRGYDE